ncbi:DcaP family trimeric outer membrane transporter [Marinobacter sp. GN3S48]|uniref:DcaP family trimeric outer membrane transporter n=1 Tax=Marinobacter sp. GN3S48 TaxID=3382302 RepID=UPI00387B6CD7
MIKKTTIKAAVWNDRRDVGFVLRTLARAFFIVFLTPIPVLAATAQLGDTVVSVNGYAKLDVIYDLDSPLGNSISHQNIRLDDEEGADGHFDAHAFESRLGITTNTPTDKGNLTTRIEGDFYGAGGTFRLRHGYGSWNGILAGQTWSNFSTFLAYTPSIDFTGLVGQTNIDRQTQLRYTRGGLSFSLEDPGTLGGQPFENTPSTEVKNSVPDASVRYEGSADRLAYSTALVLRQLDVHSDITTQVETELGYGVALSASVSLSQSVTLRGAVVYGDGIGGYLWLNPAPPAYYDPTNNELNTIASFGGVLGLTVGLGPGNFNVSYGMAKADWDGANLNASVPETDRVEENRSFYINYIWSPVEKIDYGVELSNHYRSLDNDVSGDATRLQAMVKYNF